MALEIAYYLKEALLTFRNQSESLVTAETFASRVLSVLQLLYVINFTKERKKVYVAYNKLVAGHQRDHGTNLAGHPYSVMYNMHIEHS